MAKGPRGAGGQRRPRAGLSGPAIRKGRARICLSRFAVSGHSPRAAPASVDQKSHPLCPAVDITENHSVCPGSEVCDRVRRLQSLRFGGVPPQRFAGPGRRPPPRGQTASSAGLGRFAIVGWFNSCSAFVAGGGGPRLGTDVGPLVGAGGLIFPSFSLFPGGASAVNVRSVWFFRGWLRLVVRRVVVVCVVVFTLA